MKTLALILALSLGSCGTLGITPAADKTAAVVVGDTCVVATGLINVAIVFNAKLTAPQKANVTHAISILSPICTQMPGPPTVASTAYAAFRSAAAELVTATSTLKP